jgi:ketosteroid isomerase-like protein
MRWASPVRKVSLDGVNWRVSAPTPLNVFFDGQFDIREAMIGGTYGLVRGDPGAPAFRILRRRTDLQPRSPTSTANLDRHPPSLGGREGGRSPASVRVEPATATAIDGDRPSAQAAANQRPRGRAGRTETAMSELDDFLASFLPRQIAADAAIHDGDLTPRLAIWSRGDPVTLFGAFGPCRTGWAEVSKTFEWVASRFTGSTAFTFELVAAGLSGDLAYTVGYERSVRSVDGGQEEPSTLRVTQVFRREAGEWRTVHRHADFLPEDQSSAAAAGS